MSSGTLTPPPALADNTARAILAELVAHFGDDNDQGDLKFTMPSGAGAYLLLRGLAILANRIGAVIAQPSRTPVDNLVDPYTVLISDVLIAKTAIGAGGDTITIPNNSTLRDGRSITIKDESKTAATKNITIVATGLTIDGAANYVINTDCGKVTLYSDNTTWFTR